MFFAVRLISDTIIHVSLIDLLLDKRFFFLIKFARLSELTVTWIAVP